MTSGMRLRPLSFRHFARADVINLKAMASPVSQLKQPLMRFVQCLTVAKVLSIEFDVR